MAKSPLAPKPALPQPNDPGVDALIEEISQEVKARQLNDFFKRYGKSIAVAVIAVVLGTALASAWSGLQHTQKEQDSEKLAMLLGTEPEALDPDQLKQMLKAYIALGEKGAGQGHRVLARLGEAGALLRTGEKDAAIGRLKDMQKDTSIRPLYRDYALLLELRARMDADDAQKVLDEMKPLLDPKNAWYLSALESSAVLYAKLGKKEDAVAQLQGILNTEEVPLQAKERANQLMRLYNVK